MNSEIRTGWRTAFGAPLEFLFTKRRINDKMQFVGAIQSLDTPRRAGSDFDTGHVRRGRAPTLSAGLREDFHGDFPSSESKSVVSGVKKKREPNANFMSKLSFLVLGMEEEEVWMDTAQLLLRQLI